LQPWQGSRRLFPIYREKLTLELNTILVTGTSRRVESLSN
jgi:hypothetical protein